MCVRAYLRAYVRACECVRAYVLFIVVVCLDVQMYEVSVYIHAFDSDQVLKKKKKKKMFALPSPLNVVAKNIKTVRIN